MPRKSIGDRPMTDAERQARYRAARAAGAPVLRLRRPADHRSRARRWQDAVAELKAKPSADGEPDLSLDRGWSPQINTGAAVLIPEAYVPDLNVRLALYRRLSEAERADDRDA